VVTDADGQINQAVTDQKLASAQANTIGTKIPGRVTKVVNHTF
jgi:hypothetical protein